MSLAVAKRQQALGLRTQADALELEAAALEQSEAGSDEWLAKEAFERRYGPKSFRKAREAADRGELPMGRLGDRTPLFRRSDVDAWILRRATTSQPRQGAGEESSDLEDYGALTEGSCT